MKYYTQEGPESTVKSSEVSFGPIHGKKFLRMTNTMSLWGTYQKELYYLLEAAGVYIQVWVVPIGKKLNHEKWDESIFENVFHTLRVV